jgi:hypothetical protein
MSHTGDLYGKSLAPRVSRTELAPGMEVVTADGERIGEVRSVRPNCVVVDRSGHRDLYVPLASLLEASGTRVVVNTFASQLERLGWETPPP